MLEGSETGELDGAQTGQTLFDPWPLLWALPVRFGISVVFVGPAVAPVAVQGGTTNMQMPFTPHRGQPHIRT